jgi:hypothetical protein
MSGRKFANFDQSAYLTAVHAALIVILLCPLPEVFTHHLRGEL